MDLSLLIISLGSHGCIFLHIMMKHCKKVQNKKGLTLVNIRSDHEGEFENYGFEIFCNENGFDHNFLLLELSNKMGLLKEKIAL